MQPSDFRHDPFSDVSTAVMTTEIHLVPAKSPYIVNLNEIPQKTSPSTMTVTEIDSTGTEGASFAEVAAIPESGQFWADYNTGATGSENWNTGKLLFNAADAGKMVEVTYTATGTLAGVRNNRFPSWWLDRGDGSDGDFYPTEDVTISGVKQYRSVYIPSGVTVTVSQWTKIHCLGMCVVAGTLTAVGQGAGGGASLTSSSETTNGNPGTTGNISSGGAGGSVSGEGSGGAGGTKDSLGRGIYGLGYTAIAYGGGGGSGAHTQGQGNSGTGGSGGGDIILISSSVKNTGVITADGVNGGNASSTSGYGASGGGGGGGGRMIIICNSIANTGVITANGGAGGSGGGNRGKTGAVGGAGFVFIKELGVM